MNQDIWTKILNYLEAEYPDDFITWIKPLQTEYYEDGFVLLAPNDFVVDHVKEKYFDYIQKLAKEMSKNQNTTVRIKVGTEKSLSENLEKKEEDKNHLSQQKKLFKYSKHLDEQFIFENFVRGPCNEFAFAAASYVSEKPGGSYNPLLIYGGVGLGKTHLMQAIGNKIFSISNKKRISYIHSERFVADMIKALQQNAFEEFKQHYRSLDVLLIDDIQFLVGKERSQIEFFHTFNALLEDKKQIVLTCDRYPREIEVEKRLRSRFEWGLTVAIEPPKLETRVAILIQKAKILGVSLPYEAAFFIAECVSSNVRELEGALKRVIANAEFRGLPITADFAKETLKDLISLQYKLVNIENIQRVVADFYKLKLNHLLSDTRNRAIARPRQIAMSLSKELTNKSYPEIGKAFGGKDHTTVLYACRRIKKLKEDNIEIYEDYVSLVRILTT